MRPQQWVKNLLVFGGLVFSHSLSFSSALRDSLLAFVLYCAASSAVYLLNDLCDLAEDRKHPGKCRRPLAKGILDPRLARIALVALVLLSIAGAAMVNVRFCVVIALYLINGFAYTLALKHLVIVDVMMIAFGFVLRAVGGAIAIDVVASPWLMICTMMLALVVGFGKRRHELLLLQDRAGEHRVTLDSYSVSFLDILVCISAGSAVVSYALYSMAPETVTRVGSTGLLISVPCVIYGIFRYLYLIHEKSEGGDPARLFVTDRATVVNAAVWVMLVILVIYSPLNTWLAHSPDAEVLASQQWRLW
jgi:4-hydroxybenzoate polyprenyltransferase